MKAAELQKHVFATYLTLRYGIAVLAVAFPAVVYAAGRAYGIHLQDSISSYYFSSPPDFPVRTWFVGLLFALGTALFLYRGFSRLENVLLNAAGVSAWAVALIPTPQGDEAAKFTAHGFAAVLLFLCVAAVSIYCAGDTLHLVADEKAREKLRRYYKGLGLAMIVSPALAWILTFKRQGKYIFAIETMGAIAFGFYWWKKSEELRTTGAETLTGRAETSL